MPSERVCEGGTQDAPPSCLVCLGETMCVRESVNEMIKSNVVTQVHTRSSLGGFLLELERRKCSFIFWNYKGPSVLKVVMRF